MCGLPVSLLHPILEQHESMMSVPPVGNRLKRVRLKRVFLGHLVCRLLCVVGEEEDEKRRCAGQQATRVHES